MPAVNIETFVTPWDQRSERFPIIFTADRREGIREAHGLFFAAGEIVTADPYVRKKISSLIKSAENAYYGDDEEPFLPAERFERALAEVNRAYALACASARISQELHALHLLFGVLRDRELILSAHGAVGAYLFHPSARGGGQFVDVIGRYGEAGHGDPGQLFSQVIQGTIEPKSALLALGPATRELFSPDRLAKLFGSRAPHEVLAHLQKSLTDIPGMAGGALLLTAGFAQGSARGKIPERNASHASLQRFLNTKEATATILTPTVGADIRKGVKIAQKGAAKGVKAAGQIITLVRMLVSRVRRVQWKPPVTANHARRTLEMVKDGFAESGKAAAGRGISSLRRAGRAILKGLLLVAFAIADRLKALPRGSRLILVAVIVLAIGLATSISVILAKRGAASDTYLAQVRAVEEKRDAAEAAIIYKEEDKAWTLLREAEELLKALPTNTKKRVALGGDLARTIEGVKVKLRKEVAVEPSEVIDLASQIPPAAATRLMVSRSGTPIAIGEGSLLAINVAERTAQPLALPTFSGALIGGAVAKDTLYLVSAQGTLAMIDLKTSAATTTDLLFPKSDVIPTDIALYGNRLYTLAGKQIYKHDKTPKGFSKGVPWIKADAEKLDGMAGISVDGSVWLGGPKGFAKFYTGTHAPFSLLNLDPPLGEVRAVYTHPDSKELYLLDPTRLLVFDKESGRLMAQYISPKFTNLRDFAVRESDKKAYLLHGSQIFEIPLSHLK